MTAFPRAPGWINSGHIHACPVLGTFITEWEAGAEACAALFATADSAARCGEQLAAIAAHYQVLTERMHEAVPGSKVIWYDAVTTEGKLEWQNRLTDLNRPFLDACDTLFINYTWKDWTPADVAAAAGRRAHDCLMGIDCWGRGTYGGGGMECGVALHASAAAGLSAALFAPAWPFDCEEAWVGCKTWKQRDEEFWRRIRGVRPGRRPTLLALPFHSDFSLGSGLVLMQQGAPLHYHGWYNLSRQAPQPLLEWDVGEGPPPHSQAAEVTGKAAFSGGSVVHVHSAELRHPASLRLFDAAALLPAMGLRVAFTAATSASVQPVLVLTVQQHGGVSTSVWCGLPAALRRAQGPSDEQLQVLAPATAEAVAPFVRADWRGSSRDAGTVAGVLATVAGSSASSPSSLATEESSGGFKPLTQSDAGDGLTWVTYTACLTPVDYTGLGAMAFPVGVQLLITGVQLRLEPADGPDTASNEPCELWLGDVTLEPLGHHAVPASVEELEASCVRLDAGPAAGGGSAAALSLTLSWQPPASGMQRCHVWFSAAGADAPAWEWVGLAHAPVFRVCGWGLAGQQAAVRFAVQTVGKTGVVQPLEHAAMVEVALENN
eukprot:scaffold29.g5924.t1